MYVRGYFWVVVDRIETDAPRKVEALWHWHPDCKVEKSQNSVVTSTNQYGNLKIIPLGNHHWNIEFITGQEAPEIQGWYSVEYNKYEPNIATIYSSEAPSNQVYPWILLPFEQEAPTVKVNKYSVVEDGVEISIAVTGEGQWDLFVPFTDSNLVELDRR